MHPAQLGLAALLQAALRVPDHEVVERTLLDRRWQMVLDCAGRERPLFSQGTFFNFRERLIAHGVDEVLFDKTVELHGLAGIRNRQGNRARYRSQRKNLFDLRRQAALNNLSVVDQLRRDA